MNDEIYRKMWDVLSKHVRGITKGQDVLIEKAKNFESRFDNKYDEFKDDRIMIITEYVFFKRTL